ncbi:long-chain-acyl-CoA synthetase [Pseudomonas sp. RL_15y_Pfl2_60]|uniref:long-chain-acyl-CoA synthetase n=1 Tax=Pseudomonas sp. RL_15y_Pfl2_60 TaxID=3088709 RepID=UPI0030D821FA
MRNPDLISPLDFLSRLPKQLPNLPRRLLGLYYARLSNRDKTLSLAWALQRAADKYPQRPALVDEQRSVSYTALNRWANRIAAALKADGVHAGTVVAVMLENRIELLAILAAVSKLGAISALINTTQRGKVLAHSINLVKPGYMVIGEELVSSITDAEPLLEKSSLIRYWIADQDCLQDTGIEPNGWTNLLQQAQGQPEHNPLESYDVKMKDPCFFIYTSGTTGMPKASILSHGKWIKAYGGFGHSGLALNSNDVLYLTLPCYHNNAVTVCWSAAIAGGAAIALRRGFSASAFWSDVQRYQATCFGYIGELCRYLLNQPECPEEKNNSLRCMIGNGLRPAIWQAFKDRFAIEQITEFYASSEGNIGFTNVFNFDNTVGFSPATFAIVKYDLENDRVVRNAKGFLQKAKKDVPGLLISEISDKWPFDGYTDTQKSEAAILRNVFKKGDAWYNSGDLMRDIGCKHAQFVDRLGDTFRWKGENVSTTEVESTLSTYPGIEDAVVYGVEINGTNGRCGMAALRLSPGLSFDGEALARYLDAELPSYAAPLFIRLLDQVETTGTFKYKKTDLKNAGYDPDRVQDPLFARLPGSNSFTPVTQALYQAITGGQYRF